uniref:Uncharacterized protein n=1 Tax=Nymphaea colorata TaxID=210225 RepID=A0A5K0WQI7_9MAGN
MECHRRGKKRAGPSSEAHGEPSPTHSDAHTPRGDSASEPQYAQLGGVPKPHRDRLRQWISRIYC